MTIDREKFKKTRLLRKLSQPQLAKLAHVGQTTIDKIERGETLQSRKLPQIARILGLSVEELETETANPGYRSPPALFSRDANMPVFAAAEGGNGYFILTTDPIEYVPRPYTLEAVTDAYAILIVGESMSPAYEPGDTAWVNPKLPPTRDCDVILYSVGDDAKASIKRLVSWTETEWVLRQYNPAKELRLKRAEWGKCHRVVGKFSRR